MTRVSEFYCRKCGGLQLVLLHFTTRHSYAGTSEIYTWACVECQTHNIEQTYHANHLFAEQQSAWDIQHELLNTPVETDLYPKFKKESLE